MTTGKLQSLQGLRGIAICLVVVFHLFPDKFTNGFVGVDMFFVLSGYLMTRILSGRVTFSAIIDFYQKRVIRIVPLYYLTIFVTTSFVFCLVLQSERSDFIFDLKWCLPLVSNMQPIFEHHTYWEQVSSIRYLTHLWSLCTELQYYLMAPIIHIIASQLPFAWRITGYCTAIATFVTFQLITPFEYSYSFLASRIWQFLMGSVAFELWKKYEKPLEEHVGLKKTEKRITIVDIFPSWFLTVMIVVLALPMVFQEYTTRLTMTFAAACLCFLCGHLESTVFTWPPLVYIGNLSYVTYLVHWPVINFIRYIQQRDYTGLTVIEALVAIVLMAVLSLLGHYLVERNMLQLNFSYNLAISVSLFLLCYAAIPFLETQECLAMRTLSSEQIEDANFNLKIENLITYLDELPVTASNSTLNLPGVEYCEHKGNGTGKILILSNSVGIRAFPTIFNLLNGNYEEIRLFAKHGSAPLLNISWQFNEAALQMTKDLKPEVLWFIQSMNEIILHPKTSPTNFSSAHLDEVVPEVINQFKEHADMVFVDLPYFVNWYQPARRAARSFIYRKSLNETLAVSLDAVKEQLEEQTNRLKSVNCSNCEFIDVQKALNLGQDKYYNLKPGTSKVLNYDGSHLTKTAFEILKPVYQKKIDKFLEFMNQKERAA